MQKTHDQESKPNDERHLLINASALVAHVAKNVQGGNAKSKTHEQTTCALAFDLVRADAAGRQNVAVSTEGCQHPKAHRQR